MSRGRHQHSGRVVIVGPTPQTTTHTDVLTTPTTTDVVSATERMRTPTMRDQIAALAAGTHPRCGAAGCPLLSSNNNTNCGTTAMAMVVDGTLVLRLLWAWLIDNSRFYCVSWLYHSCGRESPITITITFGVSPVLLTLTHEMRWWAPRPGEECLGSSRDYLVLHKAEGDRFLLQDRATGQRIQIARRQSFSCYSTNGKWVVVCDLKAREMVVVEIPRKNTSGAATFKKPTVVPLHTSKGTWNYCSPNFGGANEDHMMLTFESPHRSLFFEIAVVDLVQTCSSKALAVLTSTVPRLADLHLSDYWKFIAQCYCMTTQGSGAHTFVIPGVERDGLIMMDELSGRLQELIHTPEGANWQVSQLNQSQLCVFAPGMDTYTVWDVNDTSKPVRTAKCKASSESFVEGGLLFQVSGSRHEIHMTEESSGAHIITFQFAAFLFEIENRK
ncbi:hypothetical protein Pelo_5131 [Pelomyxa schiedti]|nr:hypothetical protein Pelo_5131 [Pelomyxa schiedti]